MKNKKLLIVFCGLVAGTCLLALWYISRSSNHGQSAQPQKTEVIKPKSEEAQQAQVETFELNVNEQSIVIPKPTPTPQAEPTPTSLGGILTEACDKAGISFRSLARNEYDVDLSVGRDTPLKEVLTQAASKAGLPFIEDDPNGLKTGTCKTVVLTDVAVYAGDDEKMVELLNDMGNDDPEVRSESTESLGDYEKESFEPVLAFMLRNDQIPEVRASAAIALEQAKQAESINLLIDSLYDSDEAVREHSRATLGVIGGEYVRERLYETRAVTNDTEVREIIEQILEEVFNVPLFIDGE